MMEYPQIVKVYCSWHKVWLNPGESCKWCIGITTLCWISPSVGR